MKKIITLFTILISCGLFAQTTTPDLLLTINRASQAQIDAYNPADLEIGMLVYNTDENRIFEYTDAGFLRIFTELDTEETLTTLEQDDTTTATDPAATGEITYTDEAGDESTVQVVSDDTENQIEVGTNGGAYLGPTVYSGFFIIDNTTLTASGSYTQAIADLPFEPSQITFTAHPNIGSFNINSDNALPDNPANADNNTATLLNTYGTMNGFARADGAVINQAVIFSGGSGSSINNISRYSDNGQCIGLRYTNNNGNNLGVIAANLNSFDTNGFTLNVIYTLGNVGSANIQDDILDQTVVVLYTAYK